MQNISLSTRTPKNTRLTPIGASQWVYVFRLMGLVVVADKKIRPESVAAFQDGLIELRAVIDPRLMMTRQMLLDWFKLNREDLMASIHSLEYDQMLVDILQNIRALPQKLDVVTAMVTVAIADGEYSRTEQLLIKKTILYWNINASYGEAPQNANMAAKTDKTLCDA